MREIRIAPSILAGDMSNLGEAVKAASDGGADLIHLDVIDGHFAPNITFGPATVRALRRFTDLPFDTHLMIDEPLKYVSKFVEAGSDIVHLHAEVLTGEAFDALQSKLRHSGVRVGLALKPATPLPKWVDGRLDRVDVLLVMTVNPGFSGQTLDESVLPKLTSLAQMLAAKGSAVDVEVDGGVEASNVHDVVKRGANVLVAGAGVFSKKVLSKAIRDLRERAQEALVAK